MKSMPPSPFPRGPTSQLLLVLALVAAPTAALGIIEYTDESAFRDALAAPVTIDFDFLTGGTYLQGDEYADQGLTISHKDGRPLNVVASPPVDSAWAQNVLATLPNGLSSSYAQWQAGSAYRPACCNVWFADSHSDNIQFTFTRGTIAAGVWIGENDVDGCELVFLDMDENELHRESFPVNLPHSGFFGIVSQTPIGSVQLVEAAGDNDGIIIDDLVFEPPPGHICVGFEQPMAEYPVTVRGKRALPLKALLLDSHGFEVSDSDISARPVVQVWFDSGGGDAIDVTDAVLSVGLGDDGNEFVFTEDGKWHFNLKTSGYSSPGTYTVFMESGDETEYSISPVCVTAFVIR